MGSGGGSAAKRCTAQNAHWLQRAGMQAVWEAFEHGAALLARWCCTPTSGCGGALLTCLTDIRWILAPNLLRNHGHRTRLHAPPKHTMLGRRGTNRESPKRRKLLYRILACLVTPHQAVVVPTTSLAPLDNIRLSVVGSLSPLAPNIRGGLEYTKESKQIHCVMLTCNDAVCNTVLVRN